ncbi:hypothetical protein [Pseudoalteromonas xiamenensis]
MSPEIAIILLTLIVLVFCYGVVNPRFAGSNFNKISLQDLLASIVVFSVVGSVYYGSGKTFSLFITEVNWFWFTLIVYAVIELPCFLWYRRQYGISFP